MASCLTLLVLILASMANAHPHKRRRSDDQLPLEVVVQQLAAKFTELESRLTSDETRLHALENKVAFRADFSQSTVSPPSGIFRFDQVSLNDGNGYDPTLGVFKAPVGGVYIFAFQLYLQAGSNIPQMDIKLNGNVLSRMTGVTSHDMESNMMTVAAKLSVGDKVWVEGSTNVQEGNFWGPAHTFFYGVLVYNI